MFDKYPDVLTIPQVAEALGIGRNTAYRLAKEQEIGTIHIGRKIIIPKVCLIDFISSARYNIPTP